MPGAPAITRLVRRPSGTHPAERAFVSVLLPPAPHWHNGRTCRAHLLRPDQGLSPHSRCCQGWCANSTSSLAAGLPGMAPSAIIASAREMPYRRAGQVDARPAALEGAWSAKGVASTVAARAFAFCPGCILLPASGGCDTATVGQEPRIRCQRRLTMTDGLTSLQPSAVTSCWAGPRPSVPASA